MSRKRLSTTERQRCYDDHFGICHMCGVTIRPGEEWEVSHPVPLAAGGEDEPSNRAPAHKKCHREYTAKHDQPHIAKTKRMRAKHTGAKRPAGSIPGSRNTRWKKRMNGEVVERRTEQ